MKAVLKHELSGYFHSLTAYVFGAFLLVFVGIGSMLYNIQQAVANFEYVLGFISLIFVGLVPILTMRVLAEERKQRTDQLLYSLPITTTDIILGKYLALLVVFLIPLVIVAFYPTNLCKVWRCLSFDIVWKLDRIFHYGCSTYCDRNVYFFVDRESWNGSRYLCGSCIVQLLQCQFGRLHFQQCDRFHYRTCCIDFDCWPDY